MARTLADLRPGVFLRTGHRGARGLAPENTMASFERAVSEGVDVLEFDVRCSADGEIMVIHDATVDRTTDWSESVPGEVAAMSCADLQALDAGHAFSPDGEGFPFRGQGVGIPRLVEVLEAFPEHMLTIELKPSPHPEFVPKVAELVRKHAAERAVLASFEHVILSAARREAPDLATSFSGKEIRNFFILSTAWLSWMFSTPARVIQTPCWSDHDNGTGIRLMTRKYLGAAHKKGIPVTAWTINEAAEMHELIEFGVDGITTDRPDVLNQVLRERAASAT